MDGRGRAVELLHGDRRTVDLGDLTGDARQDQVDRLDGVGPVAPALLAERDGVTDLEVADRDGLAGPRDRGPGCDVDGPGPAVSGLERQLRTVDRRDGDPGPEAAAVIATAEAAEATEATRQPEAEAGSTRMIAAVRGVGRGGRCGARWIRAGRCGWRSRGRSPV